MTRKLSLIWLSVLCLLINASIASAGVIINGVEISDDGKIIYLDKTAQGTATVKGDSGPQGPQGPKGDEGPPGQVNKTSICQVYADENLPAPPICGKKIIFVTSQQFNGNLGGLAGADAKCQAAAIAGGISGTFKAWLSIGGDLVPVVHAKDRLAHSPAPYVRTDGTIVALHWIDLTDGWLKDPIICDEYRNCSTTPVSVWTATDRRGELSGAECNGWEWPEPTSAFGMAGSTGEINYNWTYIPSGASCSELRRLYCIEQ